MVSSGLFSKGLFLAPASSSGQGARQSRPICVGSRTLICMCVSEVCACDMACGSGANEQSMALAQRHEEAPLSSVWRFLLLLGQSHVLLVCDRVRKQSVKNLK